MRFERNDVQSFHSDASSQRNDKNEGSEDRRDNHEDPSNANLGDEQISSGKERGVSQEDAPEEEASLLQKSGKDDEKESGEERWDDAEAPSNAYLEDGQTSSENERGVCTENAPEEEAASLTDNLEVEDTIFEEVSCATGLRDAEEWSDDQSDIADKTFKSPKKEYAKAQQLQFLFEYSWVWFFEVSETTDQASRQTEDSFG